MKIFVPREIEGGEKRVPLVPETVGKLTARGAEMVVESGLGESINRPDGHYIEAGASVAGDREAALRAADMVLRIRPPSRDDIRLLKRGCIHISLLDPFQRPELIRALAEQGVSAVSLEMIPRTTLAQKMDVLSSQANLAGYVAVILAAERMDKILPMMMTPAGTIVPARVFVVGAGVAGLQAIATAKRLGARVEAFDTRPVVKEQVESLGAKFVVIDVGETGQTRDGYAKALTEAQVGIQRQGMLKHCADADIVMTTAQVFGRTAPLIITADMVAAMKPGSVIVDLAVESGGNVEGSKADEEVTVDGVRILGLRNLPGRVARDASLMFSNNLGNLVEHFWDEQQKTVVLNLEDEILQGCLVTHEGSMVNERLKIP